MQDGGFLGLLFGRILIICDLSCSAGRTLKKQCVDNNLIRFYRTKLYSIILTSLSTVIYLIVARVYILLIVGIQILAVSITHLTISFT